MDDATAKSLFRLISFNLACVLNRLKYQWIFHFGALAAGGFLSFVFFHIASDFVTVGLSHISSQLSITASLVLFVFCMVMSSLLGGLYLSEPLQISLFAQGLGEHRLAIHLINTSLTILRPSVPISIGILVGHFGFGISAPTLSIGFFLALLGAFICALILKHKAMQVSHPFMPPSNRLKIGFTALTIAKWRFYLMRRHTLAILCIALGGLFLAMCLYTIAINLHAAVWFMLSTICGLWLTYGFIYQMIYEWPEKWIEKSCGVSHHDFVLSLFVNAATLAMLVALILLVFSQNIAIALAPIIPMLVYPSMIFLFETKSIIIPMIGITLVTWVLGTILYAWPLVGVLLFMVTITTCLNYQKNRFY